MITFTCPICAARLEAADDLAGSEMACGGCGTTTLVPIDLAFDSDPADAETRTITLKELQALRKSIS
jgi:hypothetical protein